jgi:hypothetical protein
VRDEIEPILDDCVRGGAFFVPPPGKLRVERSAGVRRVFLHRAGMPDERPIVEVRVEGGRVHVRRHVAMRGGEWIDEHVGSAPQRQRRLIERCIEFALVGTSRLPITSVETPLPAFTLGMIAYLPDGGGEMIVDPRVLAARVADATIDMERRARTLEIFLRAGQPVQGLDLAELGPVLRSMFNLLVLSPYTCLVDNLVSLLGQLDRPTAVDSIGYMLRHLARHLNAFDLVKFHNRGTNYPDALMLDALLRVFIPMLETNDSPAARRSLLHGWLARKRCENLLVPAAPTSPGESARQMPAPFDSADPEHRPRQLFQDAPAEAMLTPAAWALLRRAADEVDARELGTATFLDRPLGVMKRSGDADATAMLSYEAFSRRLAQRRMNELVELELLPAARPMGDVAGYPVGKMQGHAREGVVALEDAKKVALDFVITRTTRSSLDVFVRQYDWSALNAAAPDAYRWLSTGRDVLLVRTGRGEMTAFDAVQRAVLRLDYREPHYRECAGEEFVEGLTAIVGSGEKLPIPPRCE